MSLLTIDPAVNPTIPVVRGTWIKATVIADDLRNGWTLDQILYQNPEITAEEVAACFVWCLENGA